MEKQKLIKQTVLEKYGSINNFIDKNYIKLPMSRTHMYEILNYKVKNPGINTIVNLSKLLEIDSVEALQDYYRNSRQMLEEEVDG